MAGACRVAISSGEVVEFARRIISRLRIHIDQIIAPRDHTSTPLPSAIQEALSVKGPGSRKVCIVVGRRMSRSKWKESKQGTTTR